MSVYINSLPQVCAWLPVAMIEHVYLSFFRVSKVDLTEPASHELSGMSMLDTALCIAHALSSQAWQMKP